MDSRKQSHAKRILACLVALTTFLAPVSARADFAAPFVVSGGASANGGAVAIDPQGRTFFVWGEGRPSLYSPRAIRTRPRTGTGTLGAFRSVSPAHQTTYEEQVAMDTRGNALVVWSGRTSGGSIIQARVRTAAGEFGPIQTLSDPSQDARYPKLAFDFSGRALIAWNAFDGTSDRVQARSQSPGGKLGSLQTLSAAGEDAGPPNLAVSPGGRALIVWVWSDGNRYRVQAARRSSSTVRFDPATLTLSDNDRYLVTAEVAMDDDGDAIVAWDENVTGSYARSVSAGGVIGPRLKLSPADGSTQGIRVAANSLGGALFVWQLIEDDDDGRLLIQARRGTTAGSLAGAVKTIIAPTESYDVAHVALASTGEGLIAWASGYGAAARIEAATISNAGIVGAVQTVSAGSGFYDLRQLALNPSGRVVAVWNRFPSTGNPQIGAAAGTLP